MYVPEIVLKNSREPLSWYLNSQFMRYSNLNKLATAGPTENEIWQTIDSGMYLIL